MRSLIFFLLAVPLALPAQAPEVTFRSTTSEVLLDFVARDKTGRVIRNLRPDELQVFENGVPQKLRHFEFVDGRSMAPAAATSSPAAPSSGTGIGPVQMAAGSPAASPTLNQLRDISVVSLVIADLDPRGRKLTLDAMHDFLKNQLDRNTYIGVFSLGLPGIRFIQPYTNDAAKISAAVEKVTSSALNQQLSVANQFIVPDTSPGSAASSSMDPLTGSPTGPGSDPANGASNGGAGGGGGSAAAGAASANAAAASGPGAAIASFMETRWVNEMHDVYTDSVHYLAPLRALVQSQADIPGRKVVLLFGAGLPVHADTVELLQSVISTANRSNVTIYAVDTRGVTPRNDLDNARRLLQNAASASMRQQLAKLSGGDQRVTPLEAIANDVAEASMHADTTGNMAQLAEGTGGALLPASLDMRDPLRRAMEDVRTHYELTYSPTDPSNNGTFRKIEVKVARKGVTVFARSGYYALPALNGEQIYPFELATLKAINTKPVLHQFEFHATALQFRPGPVKTQLDFVFQAPTRDLTVVKANPWAKVHVCVTALIRDEQGQIVDKISKDIPYEVPIAKTDELERGVVSFTAPFLLSPGHYTLETAAIDRQSLKASVKRSALIVTDDNGLSMSDVSLARRVDPVQGQVTSFDPLESQGKKVTPELSYRVAPDTAGNVELFAVAYPPSPIDAPVDATVEIWRNGQLMMQSPASVVSENAIGAAPIMASLSAAKWPAGDYVARVSFAYKGQTVSKAVPFTLQPGS